MGVKDIEKFIEKTTLLSVVVLQFSNQLRNENYFSSDPESGKTWHDIFQQELTYPLPDNHPLSPNYKVPGTQPLPSQGLSQSHRQPSESPKHGKQSKHQKKRADKKTVETHGRKPGPREQLHTLAPFTFEQALGAMLKAKPQSKQLQTKKPAKKKTR